MPEDIRKHQRRHDGGVGLDNELLRSFIEFAPRDLLVGRSTRIRAVRRRRIADLAEVRPFSCIALEILLKHRNDANREVARDATTNLKKTDALFVFGFHVPVREFHHVFHADFQTIARDFFSIMRPAKIFPRVESSQPGTKIGRFFSAAANIHEFLGSI